jgi:hypothetical protein
MHPTQQLTALLERKHDYLSDLRDLGARQLETIGNGDLTTLMKILSAKQSLLDELQHIERQLDPYRETSPDQRVWPTPALRQHCEQLATRCRLLFAEVLQQERDAERQLVVQRDDAERQLQGMHAAAHAHGAYMQNESWQSSTLNLTTES